MHTRRTTHTRVTRFCMRVKDWIYDCWVKKCVKSFPRLRFMRETGSPYGTIHARCLDTTLSNTRLWSSRSTKVKFVRNRPVQSDLCVSKLSFGDKTRAKPTKFVNFTMCYQQRPICSPRVSEQAPRLKKVWIIDKISINYWWNPA